jgi:hypothetical protein
MWWCLTTMWRPCDSKYSSVLRLFGQTSHHLICSSPQPARQAWVLSLTFRAAAASHPLPPPCELAYASNTSFIIIVVVLGDVHCIIYKVSYNVSNISYLNSPPPTTSVLKQLLVIPGAHPHVPSSWCHITDSDLQPETLHPRGQGCKAPSWESFLDFFLYFFYRKNLVQRW